MKSHTVRALLANDPAEANHSKQAVVCKGCGFATSRRFSDERYN